MGVDTWGHVGPATKCSVPASATASGARQALRGAAASGPPPANTAADKTFTFEAWRISEDTTEVDYLDNHDAADKAGSSLLITTLAQYEALTGELVYHDAWIGTSMADVTLTAYCVDALVPATPGNDTTRGDSRFSDYVSCNNQVGQLSKWELVVI